MSRMGRWSGTIRGQSRKSAMNIGAELYSPCENPEDVRSHYNACLQNTLACLDLLVGTQNYVTMLGSSCQDNYRSSTPNVCNSPWRGATIRL